MSDLLVSSVTPKLSSGTGLRTYGVVAALARHAPVELAYVEFDGAAAADAYARLDGVTIRPLRASRGIARAVSYARARAGVVPPSLARGVSPELAGAASRAAPAVRVIADGPVSAAALLPLARRRPVVYLAHNLESSGFRVGISQSALARFERTVLSTFAESWMATRSDEEGAVRLAGSRISTRYVPNVIDAGTITPVRPSSQPTLLFVADFTYAPNREAFGYLASDVLPAIWAIRPEVELLAVGRGLAGEPRDARIRTPGFVPDLAGAYGEAAIAIVPLLRGGGSPLKFIEAMSYGLPVIATDHAARLLEEAVAGRDHLVADDPGAFAQAVDELLTDPARARAIGSAGRALVERSYSVDYLAGVLSPRQPTSCGGAVT